VNNARNSQITFILWSLTIFDVLLKHGQSGRCGNQLLAILMLWVVKEVLCITMLNNLSVVHYQTSISDAAHHKKIMANEEVA